MPLSLPLGLVAGVEQRLVHGAGLGVILDGLAALGWSAVSFLPIGHLAAASLAPIGQLAVSFASIGHLAFSAAPIGQLGVVLSCPIGQLGAAGSTAGGRGGGCGGFRAGSLGTGGAPWKIIHRQFKHACFVFRKIIHRQFKHACFVFRTVSVYRLGSHIRKNREARAETVHTFNTNTEAGEN